MITLVSLRYYSLRSLILKETPGALFASSDRLDRATAVNAPYQTCVPLESSSSAWRTG